MRRREGREGRGGEGRGGEGRRGERRRGEERAWEGAATVVSHATTSQEVHYTIHKRHNRGGHGEIPAADLFELPLSFPFILRVPPLLQRQNRRGLLDALQLTG